MMTRAATKIAIDAPACESALHLHSVKAIATAAVFAKLAKHLALLACLAIVGRANGPAAIGPLAILALVVFAAGLHSISRALARREQRLADRRRGGP